MAADTFEHLPLPTYCLSIRSARGMTEADTRSAEELEALKVCRPSLRLGASVYIVFTAQQKHRAEILCLFLDIL